MYTAYNIESSADLDEQIAARDPDQPDALEQWQALRAHYQRPQPSPRQRGLDTFKHERWNDWCDGRIAISAACFQR